MARSTLDGDFIRPDTEAFGSSPSESIDYAVMEKCMTAAVVPVDMEWSDVGSWDALWGIGDQDADGNVSRGEVLTLGCADSLFHVEGGPAIAACGVTDMIVVSTKDSVLVIPRQRAQDVKHLVDALKSGSGDRHSLPPVVHRPWGSYELIGSGEGYQAKRIIVQPGASLSLQLHRHRSEHWVVVSGKARVTIGGVVSELGPNQSTYIPVGTPHRLENVADEPLSLIEVQCGGILTEDDIVRLADNYGRSGTVG
jgi:mannose-1-phosphate guanylyltransferase/mannose-6-phosphate isomerase